MDAKEQQIVSTLSRQDLEDRYLRLRDENKELKKTSHKQEEKMKQMATKLLRLAKDRKLLQEGGGFDIELKEKNEELNKKIGTLEKQNEMLKNRLIVAKQQLQTHGKKPSQYDNVKSKVVMRQPASKSPTKSTARQQRIKEQLRVQGPPNARENFKSPHPVLPQPRYGHSLLEESRMEKRQLEEMIEDLQIQLQQSLERHKALQEQAKQSDIQHEEEKQRLKLNYTTNQRSNISENIELIKLQREVKDKINKLQTLQGKYQNLEEVLRKVKTSHKQVTEEISNLTNKLKQEEEKNSMLSNELKKGTISQQTLAYKEEEIKDLKNENELLKDAHGKLLHSTFDAERERQFRAKEKEYQLRIVQLEATIKSDVSEKNDVLDKLSMERDTSDSSQKKLRELQVRYNDLREKHESVTEKLHFFIGESATDVEEIQEALLLIKTQKEKGSHELSFLNPVDDEMKEDLRSENQQLQSEHADTINELEKTRSMLLIQHNINKDYQQEVKRTTRRMEELRRDCDEKVKEYAQLLDIKSNRIKKLEAQLHDTAYGTKQYALKDHGLFEGEDATDDTTGMVDLENGENLFEIHMRKVYLTKEGKSEFNNTEPVFFISYEFFEHELQVTSVVQGMTGEFNHISQYVVKVDDFFLHYLYKEAMVVELHQALGTEYRTIAKGFVTFNDFFNVVQDKIHGRIVMKNGNREMANLEFSMSLRVPMQQGLRLYKARAKALGYITNNELDKMEKQQPSKNEPGMNELEVTIVQCSKLRSSMKDVQPSAYCVYKFFDFDDHDTNTVKNSCSPQFFDSRIFYVSMSQDLDSYLKSSHLDVYVFDDQDPELTNYIGKCSIPLVTLSQGKPLKGKFELVNKTGDVTGTLEASLSWHSPYVSGSGRKVNTYPKPIENVNEQLLEFNRAGSVTLQPMPSHPLVSGGKLFEPKTTGSHRLNEQPQRDTDEILQDEEISKSKVKRNDERATKHEIEDESEAEDELEPTDTMFAAEDDDDDEEDSDNLDIVIPSSSRGVSRGRNKDKEGVNQEELEQQFSEVSLAGTDDTEDDVVVATSIRETSRTSNIKDYTITIIITRLTLFEGAPALNSEAVKQLFVSYKFLDYDPEDLETPVSLPKPKPGCSISFNFKKVFHVDEETHGSSRQYLTHLLMPDHPNEGRIFFTVVSDPMEGEDTDCEDVGIAYVDLIQLMRSGKDLIDEDIDVYDLLGSDGEVMGSLTVTVEAINALQSLYES